ncbi:MAG: hypothetical protein ACK5RL_11210 [Acidimicrobiales bacterium]
MPKVFDLPTSDRDALLRRYNERLAAGLPPEPGDIYSCLEAFQLVGAENPGRVTPEKLAWAARVHEQEVAEARRQVAAHRATEDAS